MNRTIYPRGWPPSGDGVGRSWGPNRLIYGAKIGFERWWLWRYF